MVPLRCSKLKRKQGVLQGRDKFIFQITPDRHHARRKLNYCLIPDPPNFSLQFTFKVVSGSVPAIFLLRITTTSNKCENLNNWKLDLKVSEFRGRVIKRVLLSTVSPFPLIKPRVQPGRVYRVV